MAGTGEAAGAAPRGQRLVYTGRRENMAARACWSAAVMRARSAGAGGGVALPGLQPPLLPKIALRPALVAPGVNS